MTASLRVKPYDAGRARYLRCCTNQGYMGMHGEAST